MALTLTKHVARRQDQSFADWCVEIRELAGERCRSFQTRPRRSTPFGAAVRDLVAWRLCEACLDVEAASIMLFE
jgi:hypothetical protein